jgi:hypothetical protein
MQDHQDPHGRARLRSTIDAAAEPRYLWLLPVALLAIGLGGYTQLDKLRALLKPAPVVEAPTVPAPSTSPAAPAITAPLPSSPARRVELPAEPPPTPAPSPRRMENPSTLLGSAPRPRVAPAPAAPPAAPAPAPARRSGQAGLVEALRDGEIRPGTAGDIGRWKNAYTRASGRGLGRTFDERTAYMEVYVVQKAFEIPDDLAGANAVVFVVETRVPFPSGDPGHSPILDTASGACVGMICRMLLTDE